MVEQISNSIRFDGEPRRLPADDVNKIPPGDLKAELAWEVDAVKGGATILFVNKNGLDEKTARAIRGDVFFSLHKAGDIEDAISQSV